MEKDVINATSLIVSARECEKGFGPVESSVLNTIMKIRRIDSPFILRVQRLSDFAAPNIGTRQEKMMSNGIISKNRRETTARTIAMNILALGSKPCMRES